MMLHVCTAVPLLSFTRILPATTRTRISLDTNGTKSSAPRQVQCMAANESSDSTIIRRTANYQRPILDYNHVQSLKSEYVVQLLLLLLLLLFVLNQKHKHLASFKKKKKQRRQFFLHFSNTQNLKVQCRSKINKTIMIILSAKCKGNKNHVIELGIYRSLKFQ